MSKLAWLAAAGATMMSLGCDALVGGRCRDGYVAEGRRCVPVAADPVDEPASGPLPAVVEMPAADPPHQGGADAGSAGAGAAGAAGGDGGAAAGGGGGGDGGAAAGGGGGGDVCEAPLSMCPSGCVDLESDPANCGACGLWCPTEACSGGECLGKPAGHLIAIAMSYQSSALPARVALGNALFGELRDPLRLGVVADHAPASNVSAVAAIVDAQAALRGRSYELTELSAGQLAEELSVSDFDALLIHDQSLAPSGALFEMGERMAPSVEAFASDGGTVVALASAAGSGQMCDLLTATGIIACTGLGDITGELVINQVPTDAVGSGVLSPFLARPSAAELEGAEPAGAGLVHVLTSEYGSPVATHRVPQ